VTLANGLLRHVRFLSLCVGPRFCLVLKLAPGEGRKTRQGYFRVTSGEKARATVSKV
jgi:hypothetical protein